MEQGGRKQECQAGGAMPEWLPGLVTGKDSQLAPGAGSGLAAGERRVRPSALRDPCSGAWLTQHLATGKSEQAVAAATCKRRCLRVLVFVHTVSWHGHSTSVGKLIFLKCYAKEYVMKGEDV